MPKPSRPRVVSSKPQAGTKRPSKKKPSTKGKYDWGDKKGRVHSRPKMSKYDRDPLYDPRKQLAGKDLRKAAVSLAETEIAPQRAALQRELGMATSQGEALGRRAGNYYTQLASQEAQRLQQLQQTGQRFQTETAQAGVNVQNQLAQTQAKALFDQSQDAALRGGGLDAGAGQQVVAETAAQSGLAAQAAGQAAYQASAQNANYGQLASLAGQARGMAGGETQRQLAMQLANQQGKIRGQLSDVEGQAGGLRTKYLTDLRQKGYENLITQAGLDIKQSDLQLQAQQERNDVRLASRKQRSTEAENRRQARLQRRGQDITARGQDVSAETQRRGQDISHSDRTLDRAQRDRLARQKARGGGAEGADARKLKTGISNALQDIRGDEKFRGRPFHGSGGRKGVFEILKERGASPLVISAAYERHTGGLSAETARELRQLGIRVPKSWVGRGTSRPSHSRGARGQSRPT